MPSLEPWLRAYTLLQYRPEAEAGREQQSDEGRVVHGKEQQTAHTPRPNGPTTHGVRQTTADSADTAAVHSG